MSFYDISWEVEFTRLAAKRAKRLPKRPFGALRLLIEDLAQAGPALADWPNYGKLKGSKRVDKRHCHLIKGRPTYVCCWAVTDKSKRLIEVYYVGTHEKAPY